MGVRRSVDPDAPSRRIALSGPLNFRDLGGYPTAGGQTVRWRRLFRSDSLGNVTPEDVEHIVDVLGLVTIVDLRTDQEVEERGRGLLQSTSVDYHHVPMLDATKVDPERLASQTLTDLYLGMVRDSGPAVARVLRILASHDDHPAVFHCAAGKDRTGIVAGVVLGLLGVSDDDIVDDYAATAEIMPVMLERFRTWAAEQGGEISLPDHVFGAEPETMQAVLAAVRSEFGTFEDYVATHGVGPDVVAGLRRGLLD